LSKTFVSAFTTILHGPAATVKETEHYYAIRVLSSVAI